ncbi:MAG TPA: sigma factor-like helix-turn-helix DNA-binding protein [Gemmata sp.]|nr:sigma factor-like helix-turn-helix DNA-binding protein [Gemmata sp.]
MDDLLSKLSGTERAVVKLVHGLENGYTNGFDEAVRLLGISPEEVRAIEAGAMTKLRPMPAGLVTVGRDE